MLKHFKLAILLATLGIVFVDSKPDNDEIQLYTGVGDESFKKLLGELYNQKIQTPSGTKPRFTNFHVVPTDSATDMNELIDIIKKVLAKDNENESSNRPSKSMPTRRFCCDDIVEHTNCTELEDDDDDCNRKLVERDSSIIAPTPNLSSWFGNRRGQNDRKSQQSRNFGYPRSFSSNTQYDDDSESEVLENSPEQWNFSNPPQKKGLSQSPIRSGGFDTRHFSDQLPTDKPYARRDVGTPSPSPYSLNNRPSHNDYRTPSFQNKNRWDRSSLNLEPVSRGYDRKPKPKVKSKWGWSSMFGKKSKPPYNQWPNESSPWSSTGAAYGAQNRAATKPERYPQRRIPKQRKPSEYKPQNKYPKNGQYRPIDLSEFRREILDRHNKYRTKHNVQKLTMVKNLNDSAMLYAKELAIADPGGNDMKPSRTSVPEEIYEIEADDLESIEELIGYGENIHYTHRRIETLSYACVDEWWSEIQFCYDNMDYEEIKEKIENGIGHLTQMLWIRSIYLGCGFARADSGAYYTVCHYSKPGNYVDVKDIVTMNLPLPFKNEHIKEGKKLSEHYAAIYNQGSNTVGNEILESDEEALDMENVDINELISSLRDP